MEKIITVAFQTYEIGARTRIRSQSFITMSLHVSSLAIIKKKKRNCDALIAFNYVKGLKYVYFIVVYDIHRNVVNNYLGTKENMIVILKSSTWVQQELKN